VATPLSYAQGRKRVVEPKIKSLSRVPEVAEAGREPATFVD